MSLISFFLWLVCLYGAYYALTISLAVFSSGRLHARQPPATELTFQEHIEPLVVFPPAVEQESMRPVPKDTGNKRMKEMHHQARQQAAAFSKKVSF